MTKSGHTAPVEEDLHNCRIAPGHGDVHGRLPLPVGQVDVDVLPGQDPAADYGGGELVIVVIWVSGGDDQGGVALFVLGVDLEAVDGGQREDEVSLLCSLP